MNIRLMVGLFCAASVCAMGGLMTQAPVALAQGTAKAKSWVEFTADGKAKQPVGYRKWVFLGS
ncbi:MAG: hypothetical protein J0M26_27400, partial [Planctomycetes bacterium]|nr:hypothetical protein [Planctomycetota bacterium]